MSDGIRGDREDAALAEQPAPVVVWDGDAPEVAAFDAGNAVVPRQPLVDERVIGVQKVEHGAVFADDAVDEQLGFAPERLTQRVVEVGEDVDVRLKALEIPEIQPLPGEVADEGARSPVSEHAADLDRSIAR
jgi:hypothetical protein